MTKKVTNQPIRVAINGFGRIGRTAFKIAVTKPALEVVAINDLGSLEVMAHLLQFDSVYGRWDHQVKARGTSLVVDGRSVRFMSEKDPKKLPWKKLKIDVVLESTGRFVTDGAAGVHLKAGAKRVIVSAPVKGAGDIRTYILGVNDRSNRGDQVFSNSSCTTNCVAPVTSVMVDSFGVRKATMTTIHSYTAEQNLVDGPVPPLHPDLRRARAAAINIVPTTSGAAISTTATLPELKGKFDGFAFRVPTACVSVTDFTFVTKRRTTAAEVNAAFRRAARQPRWQGILGVTDLPLVSTDFLQDPHSAIVDLRLTNVVDNDLVKVVAWYDNEWGYSNRYVEQAIKAGRQVKLAS
ncbi:MAG: type I glyceraldehyde-3-phosphate dehydrogenase [Candidatus Kerfeldbacteria bacterium]|nr:type I glyceraldehyde-3-phosphate dehydrogenase [Candidatus Kerfeldbacteria bacterium]